MSFEKLNNRHNSLNTEIDIPNNLQKEWKATVDIMDKESNPVVHIDKDLEYFDKIRQLIKFDNLYDSFSDDNIDDFIEDGYPFLILNNKFKDFWDYLIILLVFASSILTPFE